MEEKVRGAAGRPEPNQARRHAFSQAATQGHTQQSLPTTFLPTPAPRVDQRRIRDFTTTSHLEVSASNQAMSQQVAPSHSPPILHEKPLLQHTQWACAHEV
jgi:hypothetical protein